MIKKINLLPILFACLLIASCGGSDDGGGDGGSTPPPTPNSAPTRVSTLVYPTADLLCIDNTINFQWSASTDPDGDTVTYTLRIALDRDMTNIVEQLTASTNSRSVTLDTGTAYYWNVIAKDSQDEAAPSQTYAFYTEGDGVSNYAPFTATLNAPEMDGFVDAGTTTLSWTGGDADVGDTLTYDVYFGDTNNPALVQSDVSASTFDVTTVAATTYYWRIDTKDDSGTKSIGQVWSFTTN
ncbi:hypothetical protein [Olleya aquimaris]|uniref:Fibronectin type-III domain-containing protein n=1 Tax=Olleya aquimaris TaxID=639310 RepID=A0A327RFW6_9FLAO|nr:hypothetical protein [Olleya aquimaris]RAJ15035.1 hypothetical protein LY08_01384 [Olleya aquimaris]